MSWNYRVLAIEDGNELYFRIHSVYYNEDGKPDGYSAQPATNGSGSIEWLEYVLDLMREALKKPILWGDNRFPEECKDLTIKTNKNEDQED